MPGEIKAGQRAAGGRHLQERGWRGTMSCPSLVARRQVSVRVGGCRGHGAPWREVGCAANPTSGHRAPGTEPGGTCLEGASTAGSRSVPAAAGKNHRQQLLMATGLTSPSRGAAGLQRVWPSPTMIFFFANQFPTDVALLHMLQLALCSPEALTKAELSLCTGISR